jgi:hypothetical protein
MFEVARSKKSVFPFEAPPFFEDDLNEYWVGMISLVNYNLGIIHAMEGDYEKAKEFISISIKELEKQSNHECECLFVPQILANKLEFVEVFKPDLLVTAKASIETIDKFVDNGHEL